jgi:hypothetical protein
VSQGGDSLGVDAGRVQEPVLFLVPGAELAGHLQVLAHLAHPEREFRHGLAQRLGFEIVLHLVPVGHSPGLAERSAEKRHQVILVPAGYHGLEDLIEVEVAEHLRVVALGAVPGTVEQDAAKWRYRIQACLHQHVVRQKPSAVSAVRGELHRLSQILSHRRGVVGHAARAPSDDTASVRGACHGLYGP